MGSIRYTSTMARGWESKSIEDQQAQYEGSRDRSRPRIAEPELAKRRVVDGLRLSRERIVQQLESSQATQHRTLLESALSYLDAEISRLDLHR